MAWQMNMNKWDGIERTIWKNPANPNSPFGEKILEMDHLHHDGHVFLRSRAQVVFDVAFSLELEHHLFYGHTLSADAAELVP